MTLKLEFHCAMCGAEKNIAVKEVCGGKIDVEIEIKLAGWIPRQNGPNFDIYCSKRCAA